MTLSDIHLYAQQGYVLIFRNKDRYEIFGKHAELAAVVLGLELGQMHHDGEEIPRVWYRKTDNHPELAKLIRSGAKCKLVNAWN